jgi:hypothetical protein
MVSRVNCCWPLPVQLFLVEIPTGSHANILMSHDSASHVILLMLKLIYNRRSVGQSILVSASHLKLMTIFLFSDDCVFLNVGHPL